jgi:hypothetical protein
MKCEIVNFLVPDNPYSAGFSSARPYCRCNTHGMQDFAPGMLLCPVGKIEQAVEDGLAKIAAALTAEQR